MVEIKITGEGAQIVSTLVTRALREKGMKCSAWDNVAKTELPECRRDARMEKAEVMIVSGKKL